MTDIASKNEKTAERIMPKPSIGITIWCWCIYLLSSPYTLIMCGRNKLYTGRELVSMILSIPFLLYFVVYIFLCFMFFRDCMKSFKKFDGSDLQTDKLNKLAGNFGNVSIAFPILNSIIYPILFNLAAKKQGITSFDFVPFCAVSVGSTFLFSLFSYVMWIETFEAWLDPIPFQRKHMNMSLLKRYLYTYGFSVLGIILLAVAPMFMKSNKDVELSELFMTGILPSLVIGYFLGVIDFIVMTRGVTNRLKKITSFSESLANGDYTTNPIPIVSREEIGILTVNVNVLHDSTKNLLGDVSNNIEVSGNIAEKLTNNMQTTASSVSQIIGNIGNIRIEMESQGESVKEASVSAAEILNNIQTLNNSIESQSAAVEESSAAVRQMVANIQSVTNILDKNNVSMKELSDASDIGHGRVEETAQRVEKVLQDATGLMEASTVIQNIAEQTNLLAMNAAIEAAHAGESGKGFAVVASEIRKLAEDSNKQGKVIAESLQLLDEVISGVADSTRGLKEQFDVIFKLTKVVQQQEEIVKNAMEEQNQGSAQILEAMKAIDEATIVVKQGAGEMLENGRQVSSEMENLTKTTGNVTQMINEMANGTDRIHSSVNEVNEYSAQNKTSIDEVRRNMKSFKTT